MEHKHESALDVLKVFRRRVSLETSLSRGPQKTDDVVVACYWDWLSIGDRWRDGLDTSAARLRSRTLCIARHQQRCRLRKMH